MSGSTTMHEITGRVTTLSDGSTAGMRFLIEVELDEQVEIFPPLGTHATLAWDGTAFIIPEEES